MLTIVRSTLAGACLLALGGSQAAALQCDRVDVTSATSLRWAEHIALVTTTEGRKTPHNGFCTFDATVTTPVKGQLFDGKTVTVTYAELDGGEDCNLAGTTEPIIGQYNLDKDGIFSISLCESEPDQATVYAYVKQKQSLEAAASRRPKDLSTQIRLARFFINWDDLTRAAPAVAKVAELAPGDPETRLLEASLLLLSRPDRKLARQDALVRLEALQDSSPMAKLLLEQTRSQIDLQKQVDANGRLPTDVDLRPIMLSGWTSPIAT